VDVSLGERELDVLSVLWRHGPGTVADVREQLPAELAYNTVLTILRNLEAKELVGHAEEGRLHRYHALVQEERVRGSQVARLTQKLFRGSPLDLLTHLVTDTSLSTDDVRALQQLLDARLATADTTPPAGKPDARRRK
jgi:BlaI family transcriptional regulator, penicillinase repressor